MLKNKQIRAILAAALILCMVSNADMLQKTMQLKISRWRYKQTNEFYIGPMAQDFYYLFNTGDNNTSISTIDPSGVAFVGILALYEEIAELKKKIDALEKK